MRSLDREISKICRKTVKSIQLKQTDGQVVVTEDNLNDFLGVRKFDFGRAEKKNQVGQVVGLAWTEVGWRFAHHRGGDDARQRHHHAHVGPSAMS